MTRPAYRPDIDGLRCLAVVPVVLFHLGAPWMPGGFVGVDVFFVISGFLITTIISRDIAAGSFSILTFYERRIRRIFPALFAVLAVSLIGAAILFVPQDLVNMAQSAVAAVLFSANILFFLEAGYFDASSYEKPLLHTWSLGIEEQFYIFLPLLLLVIARRGGRMLPWVAGLTAASLALSIATTKAEPTAAYYLLPWRAWELGIGAMLALGAAPTMTHPLVRQAAGATGFALILGSALLITRETPFPGAAALAPTLGAALILHAGSAGSSVVGRLLSTPPAVWVGRLSYSFYLWHWPVIVAFVYLAMRMPEPAEAAGLFALSLGLSWISFRFVEMPFRRPPGMNDRRYVFGSAAAGTALTLTAAGLLLVTGGLPGRLPDDVLRISASAHDTPERMGECYRRKTAEESWLAPCIFGAGTEPARIAIWGDSHAPTMIPAIEASARARGVSVALYARDGCPPIEGFQVFWVGQSHDCAAFIDRTYPAILADPEIEVVVIALRAPIYTQGWLPYGLAERDRTPLLIGDRSGPLAPDSDRAAFFFAGIERTIEALEDAGKAAALVYPLPEAGFAVPAGLARTALWRGPHTPVVSRTLYDGRSAGIVAAYDALVARTGAIPIRLDKAFCGALSCDLVRDDVPVFRDSNHLTATVARGLSAYFDPVLDHVRTEAALAD